MACKRKRAKLLPDLEELASKTRETKKVLDEFKRAMEAVQSLSLVHVQTASQLSTMTEDQVFSLLVCKFGIAPISRAIGFLARLPLSTPDSTKQRYLRLYGLADPELASMVDILNLRCPSATTTPQGAPKHHLLLAPPTRSCLECGKDLTTYHTCEVKYYSLQGFATVDKLSLRCQDCGLLYNYSQYGNKHTLGFRYYDVERDSVEVNDCVYFDRNLLELQCSLANHAWVSFEGFGEAYNDAFGLPRQQEITGALVASAFYNGELEDELRKRDMVDYRFKSDSDREKCMELIERLRVNDLYPHPPTDCSPDCAERGCGHLWVTDGIWKAMFPHCMFRVEQTVGGLPALNMPDVCTASPAYKQAFCPEHCQLLQSQTPPIPTGLRSFLDYCKHMVYEECDAQSVTPEDVDKVVRELLPHATESCQSAAESQGTAALLTQHPQLAAEAVSHDPTQAMCRKDTGKTKRLRRWSRGHQFIVRGGGHIDTWQPLYKSESPCQVFLIILTWLLATFKNLGRPSTLPKMILAYDNMCNLCRLRVSRVPLPFPPPLDNVWLGLEKIIDSFHIKNHISPDCLRNFSPEKMKEENKHFNTQAGEQTFVWVSRFRHILCAMNKVHHLFYLHRMVQRRNKYTSKCYKHGSKPKLPQVTHSD